MSTYHLSSTHQAYKDMQENGDGFAMQESCDVELMLLKDLASVKAAKEISLSILHEELEKKRKGVRLSCDV